MSMAAALTIVSCSDKQEAEKLAQALVAEKVCACVTVIDNVWSVYRWQGEVTQTKEVLLLIKHQKQSFNKLSSLVTALHTYDNPEIIQIPIEQGAANYLAWLKESCD